MSLDIMVDLETLGTEADAVILSIGAVVFDLEAGGMLPAYDGDPRSHTFYAVLDIDSQPRRHISGGTIAWWMAQTEAARAVFFGNKNNGNQASKAWHYPARSALISFGSWVQQVVADARVPPGDLRVWSNGADFDLPMLAHACRSFNVTLPWPPYAGRCYRTYKNLPGARAIKVERSGEHHNALDDAIYQAQHLCAIYTELFAPRPAVDAAAGELAAG